MPFLPEIYWTSDMVQCVKALAAEASLTTRVQFLECRQKKKNTEKLSSDFHINTMAQTCVHTHHAYEQ